MLTTKRVSAGAPAGGQSWSAWFFFLYSDLVNELPITLLLSNHSQSESDTSDDALHMWMYYDITYM